MSEDSMNDAALEANEHREHAEHAEHPQHPLVLRVTITIAVLAVLSAGISTVVSNEDAAAVAARSEAVLHQDRATDTWNFFQAKTIKATLYELAAQNHTDATPANAAEAARQRGAVDQIQAQARHEDALTAASLEEADRHERRHHFLEISEALSHIAIAIATVAIVTRQRWPWFGSLALGVISIGIWVCAYLL
jgi:hypothetical protein